MRNYQTERNYMEREKLYGKRENIQKDKKIYGKRQNIWKEKTFGKTVNMQKGRKHIERKKKNRNRNGN